MWTRRDWPASKPRTAATARRMDIRQAAERRARPQVTCAHHVLCRSGQALLAEGREPKLRYEYWAPKTQPLGTGGDMHVAFSYAVHAALVSVDLETGEVAVERVVAGARCGPRHQPAQPHRPDRGRHRHGHRQCA